MLNVFVAQVGLYSAGIVSLICEGVAAGVAKHVGVNARELARFPGPRHHLGKPGSSRPRFPKIFGFKKRGTYWIFEKQYLSVSRRPTKSKV